MHLTTEQVPFEEALLKSPHNESLWLDYVEAHQHDLPTARFILSRAVAALPESVILWNTYLRLPWGSTHNDELRAIYKQVLTVHPAVPAYWLEYIALLRQSPAQIADLTRALDSALMHLDQSHHPELWQTYTQLLPLLLKTAKRELYVRLFEAAERNITSAVSTEDCVVNLCLLGDHQTSEQLFVHLMNQPKPLGSEFVGDYVKELLQAGDASCALHLEDVVARYTKQYPQKASELILYLANFYALHSAHEETRKSKVRICHHSAMDLVISPKSLAHVYQHMTDWEEEQLVELNPNLLLDIKLFGNLVAEYPVVLNDFLLNKAPHCIDYWLDRAEIYDKMGNSIEKLNTYVKAIRSINPFHLYSHRGKTLSALWIEYAEVYSASGDLDTAHLIFSRAVKSQFRSPDELAELHIRWTENLLLKSDELALEHMEECTVIPRDHENIQCNDKKVPVQNRLFKSNVLWTFYLDLLKSIPDSTSSTNVALNDIYSRMAQIRVITLRLLFEHADLHIEAGNTSNALAVYENGLQTFRSPEARFRIWTRYLDLVIKIYNTRETVIEYYEKAIATTLPLHRVSELYKAYIQFELDADHITRAVTILQNAISHLSQGAKLITDRSKRNKVSDDKHMFYSQLILIVLRNLKDDELHREVLSSAIQDTDLPFTAIRDITFDFVDFEISKSEVARARALYKYVAGLLHPNNPAMDAVWERWEAFEITHGTRETLQTLVKTRTRIKEEFKHKANVQQSFNPIGFVKLDDVNVASKNEVKAVSNPDLIDIDMDL